LAHLLH